MKTGSALSQPNRQLRFLLGLYIQRKRIESDYSVTELASALQLTAQAVQRIECGRLKVSLETFQKIEALLLLESDELNDIQRISNVAYVNDLAKFLVPDFPS